VKYEKTVPSSRKKALRRRQIMAERKSDKEIGRLLLGMRNLPALCLPYNHELIGNLL
jgi:hypothetical protein